MNVTVETQHVTIPRHADRSIVERARTVFSRLNTRISHLSVTLKDINGPRGGEDKVCIVRARLTDGGEVLVEDRSSRLRNAVGGAFKRARMLINKEIKRRQQRRPRQRNHGLENPDLETAAV